MPLSDCNNRLKFCFDSLLQTRKSELGKNLPNEKLSNINQILISLFMSVYHDSFTNGNNSINLIQATALVFNRVVSLSLIYGWS